MTASKRRLDRLLVDLGIVDSRQQAQAFILAGKVLVGGQKITKAGTTVPVDAAIELLQPESTYVSRGGEKLAAALDHFSIDVKDKIAVDAGISTGGFTDCLLQRGIKQVYGIDVGYGDVAWQVRNDPRVVLFERTNLRHLFSDSEHAEKALELKGRVDLVTLDLSFISLIKVLEVAIQLLKRGGELLLLIKPQFELNRQSIGKGGIVRNTALQHQATHQVEAACEKQGLKLIGSVAAAIKGAKGNQEYFSYAKYL